MSGDERSREALTQTEIRRLEYHLRGVDENTISDFIVLNGDNLERGPEELLTAVELRWSKLLPEKPMPELWNSIRTKKVQFTEEHKTEKVKVVIDEKKAPEFIKNLSKSEPQKPPESQDIKYLSELEISVDRRINTLEFMLVEDPDLPNDWTGPFIERCVGRDKEDGRLQVVRIRARAVPIEPLMVMQYLGSVIRDKQAVHTTSVLLKSRRYGYCFDRFYIDPRNQKRFERCALVTDRIHQSGMMYEKIVDKRTRKALARIRRQRGPMNQPVDDPMYRVIGASEGDYRDLKRLFERHFLKRGDEDLADDVGLSLLVGK
jgi:hypothetical protein